MISRISMALCGGDYSYIVLREHLLRQPLLMLLLLSVSVVTRLKMWYEWMKSS